MLYTYIPIHIKKPVLLVPMMDLLVLQHTSRKFTFHDTHVLTLCLPKGIWPFSPCRDPDFISLQMT